MPFGAETRCKKKKLDRSCAHILSTTTTTATATTLLSSHFGPSAASAVLFPSVTTLSPQERENMADITLDPDYLEPSRVSSSARRNLATSTVTGGIGAGDCGEKYQ